MVSVGDRSCCRGTEWYLTIYRLVHSTPPPSRGVMLPLQSGWANKSDLLMLPGTSSPTGLVPREVPLSKLTSFSWMSPSKSQAEELLEETCCARTRSSARHLRSRREWSGTSRDVASASFFVQAHLFRDQLCLLRCISLPILPQVSQKTTGAFGRNAKKKHEHTTVLNKQENALSARSNAG